MSIYDVAKEAGVSTATVSRLINNSGYVGEETRKKIEQAIESTGFSPGRLSHRKSSHAVFSVALLLEDVRLPTHASIVYGVESKLFTLGADIVVCNTGIDMRKFEQYVDSLKKKNVDAFIISGAVYDHALLGDSILKKLGKKPIIAINGMHDLKGDNVYHIFRDEEYGVRCAVEYFVKHGHKRIAYAGTDRVYSTGKIRRKEFLRVISEYGIINESNLYAFESSFEGGMKWAKEIARTNEIPTAIFFDQSWIAAGAIRGFQECGLNVPEDISVICLTDTGYSKYSSPGITTVEFSPEQIGVAAATIVGNILDGDVIANDISIRPTMIEHESVRDFTK